MSFSLKGVVVDMHWIRHLLIMKPSLSLPGLDKIKTFREHSLNFSKLSVKVRKLWQENLRQKVWNLWNQESLNQIYFVFGIEILIIIRIIPIIVRWMVIIYFFVTDTVCPAKSKHKRIKLKLNFPSKIQTFCDQRSRLSPFV